ncbi:MAG: SMC-Scp complex subunit ScpB [Firmicutes bacterium]|nr:SMC-Scp complex subunit ScpB [Bacillota bacterium]
MDLQQLKQGVECLLFVAAEPVSLEKLAEITGNSKNEVQAVLCQLSQEYEDRGFHLRHVAGGWQLTSDAQWAPLIEKLYRPKLQQLSAAAMETLAIVAYRQPIAKADVAAIRQVDADGVMAKLLEKRLIKEVGRRAGPGRAVLYGTTDDFLRFFGLESLDDLPKLAENPQNAGEEIRLGGDGPEQLTL